MSKKSKLDIQFGETKPHLNIRSHNIKRNRSNFINTLFIQGKYYQCLFCIVYSPIDFTVIRYQRYTIKHH